MYKIQGTADFSKVKKLALHVYLIFTSICPFTEDFIMRKGEIFSDFILWRRSEMPFYL